jgi:hypothetical protein
VLRNIQIAGATYRLGRQRLSALENHADARSVWLYNFVQEMSPIAAMLAALRRGTIRMKTRVSRTLVGAAFVLAASTAEAQTTFSIDWHVISSGGTTLSGGNTSRSTCFIVNGTLAQVAPGYSSGGIYSVYAGFWTGAPTRDTDEIFFDGFEGCSP